MKKSPIPVSARLPEPAPGGAGLRLATINETLSGKVAPIDDKLLARLEKICSNVFVDEKNLIDAARDWWPLGMVWATTGRVARLPAAVVRPTCVEEISAILALCNETATPVTTSGGRSGVLGNSLPVFGGVVLDCTLLSGIADLREDDLTVDVLAGTFGDDFEAALQKEGYTAGHWPQSVALSTIGGWIACNGAGQMSTRYGTMADITKGVTAVLADGRVIETSDYAQSATGPDLTQLFVGSEGTLGVIISARLHIRPLPDYTRSAAIGFKSFDDGVDAIRRFMRRGANPAVVRLYDDVESHRNFGTEDLHVLLLRDEGDRSVVDGGWTAVLEECDGEPLNTDLVDGWMSHRNQVKSIEPLIEDRAPDTMEITAPWSALAQIYHETTAAMFAVEGTRTATAHLSHAYGDRAGLYFMFGGRPDINERPRWYRDVWDAAARTVFGLGGNLSHHHGIGLARSRFMKEALGSSFDVLIGLKQSMDPNGILNPGKMGLDSPFGPPPEWADTAPKIKG
ncbi:MAG: FAD-binding oxidoreductase [Sneathiella sp.]|uniref:FAD-binding oxidoreductase n=1 Tax=Sneathiella sp. TaxID=1964365 RepID=UPI003003409F